MFHNLLQISALSIVFVIVKHGDISGKMKES